MSGNRCEKWKNNIIWQNNNTCEKLCLCNSFVRSPLATHPKRTQGRNNFGVNNAAKTKVSCSVGKQVHAPNGPSWTQSYIYIYTYLGEWVYCFRKKLSNDTDHASNFWASIGGGWGGSVKKNRPQWGGNGLKVPKKKSLLNRWLCTSMWSIYLHDEDILEIGSRCLTQFSRKSFFWIFGEHGVQACPTTHSL